MTEPTHVYSHLDITDFGFQHERHYQIINWRNQAIKNLYSRNSGVSHLDHGEFKIPSENLDYFSIEVMRRWKEEDIVKFLVLETP